MLKFNFAQKNYFEKLFLSIHVNLISTIQHDRHFILGRIVLQINKTMFFDQNGTFQPDSIPLLVMTAGKTLKKISGIFQKCFFFQLSFQILSRNTLLVFLADCTCCEGHFYRKRFINKINACSLFNSGSLCFNVLLCSK